MDNQPFIVVPLYLRLDHRPDHDLFILPDNDQDKDRDDDEKTTRIGTRIGTMMDERFSHTPNHTMERRTQRIRCLREHKKMPVARVGRGRWTRRAAKRRSEERTVQRPVPTSPRSLMAPNNLISPRKSGAKLV